MTLPNKVRKALVDEKELPSDYEKRLKQFAFDFGLGVREGLCARELSLHNWRYYREQEYERDVDFIKENFTLLLFKSPDDRFRVNRDIRLNADPDGFMTLFNDKWKQDSFKHDDDLIADLCLRGLLCDSRGGARLGAGTYALTDNGLRQSDTALRQLLYQIVGEDLSPSSWGRVFVFFIIAEFIVAPILAPMVNPVLESIAEFFRAMRF